jgi:hypothetical protein
MKWLIVLFFVACGKHETPKAIDYQDSDGDQVLNYQETSETKYIAELKPLGKLTGTLRFKTEKLEIFPFSNQLDINRVVLEAAVANEERYKINRFFAENSELHLTVGKPLKLSSPQYQVSLEFDTSTDTPDALLLRQKGKLLSLGDWSPSMQLVLSGDVLEDILTGESTLLVRRKNRRSPFESQDAHETVQEKSYRVFFHDGREPKILYVSRELTPDALKDFLKVTNPQLIDDDSLFFDFTEAHLPQWFYRSFKNGDLVLVKMPVSKLREELLKRFDQRKKILKRFDGKAANFLELNNVQGSRVYVIVKEAKGIERVFVESKKKRRYAFGGRENIEVLDCTHFFRKVKQERPFQLGLEEALLRTNFYSQVETAVEAHSTEGVHWGLKLSGLEENAKLMLKAQASETFVKTGEYRNTCGHRYPPKPKALNFERTLSFVVESYVEKVLK